MNNLHPFNAKLFTQPVLKKPETLEHDGALLFNDEFDDSLEEVEDKGELDIIESTQIIVPKSRKIREYLRCSNY